MMGGWGVEVSPRVTIARELSKIPTIVDLLSCYRFFRDYYRTSSRRRGTETRESCSRILKELGHAVILTYEENPVAWCNFTQNPLPFTQSPLLLYSYENRHSVSSQTHRLLRPHFIFRFPPRFPSAYSSLSAYSICQASSRTTTALPDKLRADKRKLQLI